MRNREIIMNTEKLPLGLVKIILSVCIAFAAAAAASAQENVAGAREFKELYRDTTVMEAPASVHVERDSIYDPMRVVTNRFGKDWFINAAVGIHTFRGDYSNLGNFGGTLSPDFEIGFGKWFTPGIALRLGVMYSNSRGYFSSDLHDNPHMEDYSYDGFNTRWFDFNAGALLNLSRLIAGYEGAYSRKMMNQFYAYAGLGVVHHIGYGKDFGSQNELSARTELQYSRFFNPKKKVSLDFKIRGIFYQSDHDGEHGQSNYAAKKIDYNVGAALGLTFYLGKGWGQSTTKLYQRDYTERNVTVYREREAEVPKIEYGTLTFYVFYPNNYSGRDDAPIVADAPVNAIEYLAGGIFTQKRYLSTSEATSRLLSGESAEGLTIVDIPTESACSNFEIDFVPRGYEMLNTVPMSLSLMPEDMIAFREKAGFYYAPIFDGQNAWMYRVDNAALGQNLLSSANYSETYSFGLNSHSGLNIISEQMDIDAGDRLVSFADVYAALNENEGYVSQFTDPDAVDQVRRVLNNGVITLIQAEGLATSQDNYSGSNARQIANERNTALSQNRANTVVKWLKGNECLGNAASQIYLVNSMNGPVRTVKDKSTRGLDAKLNRCVKVRIHYMMK